MIAIDTAFFLLELICGFLAHSLALTADAFHMVRQIRVLPPFPPRPSPSLLCRSHVVFADFSPQLNDIISLVIGLWAVVAAQKETTDEFTFGVRMHSMALLEIHLFIFSSLFSYSFLWANIVSLLYLVGSR